MTINAELRQSPSVSSLVTNLEVGTTEERAQFSRLTELLGRSRLSGDITESVPRELSSDRSSAFSTGAGAAEREVLIHRAATAEQEYRIFRREAPVGSPALGEATPTWGRGAAIAESLGPFHGLDGRQFWFDFFPIVHLVPVHFAGESEPVLLFSVREDRQGLENPLAIHEILPLLQQRYELGPGSIWIKADTLAVGAPADAYVGLRISGGQITFEPPPIDGGGRLTIPADGRCTMELELQAPAVPPGAAGAGRDAADAGLKLPSSVSFALVDDHAEVTQLADASWRLYGESADFLWHQGEAPIYEAVLDSVLIAMAPSVQEIEPEPVESPFVDLTGRAPIGNAGWSLPVAAIDVTQPTEASGAGGMAVQTDLGLSITWRGLRDGPVRLPAPWLTLSPGLISIVDPQASNLYAHQRLRLWKDGHSRFRSELELRYTRIFPLKYVAASSGAEVILAATDVDARLDRPVDVRGDPLPVRTLGSRFMLTYTDALAFALLSDDHILVDSLEPNVRWAVEPSAAISLAIRNALFTTTPVSGLLLAAELLDEEAVEKGTLLLVLGLYDLTPTLPDPYAARVGRSLDGGGRERERQVRELLIAAVGSKKANRVEDPDEVATRFSFAPLEQSSASPPTGSRGQPSAVFASMRSTEDPWREHFGAFEREEFALLDVSSNADQMGVSFAWFNPAPLDERDLAFYQVFGVKEAEDPLASAPGFPLQVKDLDLTAQGRFVRAFTVPQFSWEPLINLTEPALPGQDPPAGFDLFPNDGGPTRLFTDSVELVPIAPIPVMEFLAKDFREREDGFTGALFTLPFGLHAFAEFSRRNQFTNEPQGAAALQFNAPEYGQGDLIGGLQLRVDAPEHPPESAIFKGSTLQLDNLVRPDGTPTGTGTLGHSVGEIFNKEFFYDGNTGYKDRGVPVTRIDFSGYGASIFSRWQNPNAVIAATSQAHFDAFVGRASHEVIQVRSLVYPWGIRVVRTITMFRVSSGYVFRYDSGWQAESDGTYDFRYNVYNPASVVFPMSNPYTVHPGIVRGVFTVRNIRETDAVPTFTETWIKVDGDSYLDDNGVLQTVDASTPTNERNPKVELQPVYFDADAEIEGVVSGANGNRVASKGMLGYVQLSPRGVPISPDLFAKLLASQFGGVGGPVDCVIDVGASGQLMRVSRVDVNPSRDSASRPIFVSAARGAVTLPKDGSWSVVQHDQGSGEVSQLDAQTAVPLIRRGKLDSATGTTDATSNDLLRLANPTEIIEAPGMGTKNFGLLQSTGTQKALFRLPGFQEGSDILRGAPPDFADAYRMINSSGIFPNVQDALPLALGSFQTKILAEGYRLLDQADPDKVFEQLLPEGPLYLINEQFLKLYVEYAPKDKDDNPLGTGSLRFGFDASANDVAKRWLSKVNDIGMVVDLGPLKRLMIIRGKLDAEKGSSPAFKEPELVFSDALQPVIDILQILEELQGGDYAAAFQKGLDVAMSNSADSWNYAFHARKEIPVVKFPPEPEYSTSAVDPLKLEAHLAVGVYFNEAMQVTSDPKQLVPSAGAFLEFGGSLSVMCVSLAAATIYATGSVDLITAADIKTGPSLHMKFGFGAEIMVGLPVVGGVSLLYMVGVQIDLDTTQITIAGFLLFRGRAELLGGLVTVQIQIEAKGSVQRTAAPESTNLIAQVTFGLDISIFLVINISFSQSWQEARQIA
jgi:hypothetical protein